MIMGTDKFSFYTAAFLLRLIVTISWYNNNNFCVVQSWSFSDNNTNSNNSNYLSRRQIMKKSLGGTMAATITVLLTTASSSVVEPVNAACLQGDLRKECIGVYKVPIDDAIKSYISTPEALTKFAPDLKFVDPIEYSPPTSYNEAIDILTQQQYIAKNDIKQYIAEGKLELAGQKVLYALPKITVSGRYIKDELESRIRNNPSSTPSTSTSTTLESSESSSESSESSESTSSTTSASSSMSVIDELKIDRIEDQFNLMIGYWGGIDIEIGQGLRGDLGVSAVAQLLILETLRDVTCAIDDFLVTATVATVVTPAAVAKK
ncbi:hypothetical protein FRACYDRAFT_250173 [Fragilariopsis cylindrus CCMP1102]|uniref:Uncharacterized protein n=1 Tax=Fragilariopsis cylindrus CCMP1102 TaxID=635003 RepID=A0A1E7ERB8_9STRA|nr:hypothetical protein FRACYDRAFT_250173 [Fragilariopsis cylindrus CCMP1102]|eukprot:OEU08379.1 hypothetical protein FRACYDRAFT_250173 [Fragilariopsis cylindrus CCMP1102]